MNSEALEKWARLGLMLLVVAGYFVFLAVLFQRTMQTDAFLRSRIDDIANRFIIPDSPADMPTTEAPREP